MQEGYGRVYQSVMRNPSLTIESKAIYAYLASLAGAKGEAFPSISLMTAEVGISKTRLYRHLNLLVDEGIVVRRQTFNGNLKGRVVYQLNDTSVSSFCGNREIRKPSGEEGTRNNQKNEHNDFKRGGNNGKNETVGSSFSL